MAPRRRYEGGKIGLVNIPNIGFEQYRATASLADELNRRLDTVKSFALERGQAAALERAREYASSNPLTIGEVENASREEIFTDTETLYGQEVQRLQIAAFNKDLKTTAINTIADLEKQAIEQYYIDGVVDSVSYETDLNAYVNGIVDVMADLDYESSINLRDTLATKANSSYLSINKLELEQAKNIRDTETFRLGFNIVNGLAQDIDVHGIDRVLIDERTGEQYTIDNFDYLTETMLPIYQEAIGGRGGNVNTFTTNYMNKINSLKLEHLNKYFKTGEVMSSEEAYDRLVKAEQIGADRFGDYEGADGFRRVYDKLDEKQQQDFLKSMETNYSTALAREREEEDRNNFAIDKRIRQGIVEARKMVPKDKEAAQQLLNEISDLPTTDLEIQNDLLEAQEDINTYTIEALKVDDPDVIAKLDENINDITPAEVRQEWKNNKLTTKTKDDYVRRIEAKRDIQPILEFVAVRVGHNQETYEKISEDLGFSPTQIRESIEKANAFDVISQRLIGYSSGFTDRDGNLLDVTPDILPTAEETNALARELLRDGIKPGGEIKSELDIITANQTQLLRRSVLENVNDKGTKLDTGFGLRDPMVLKFFNDYSDYFEGLGQEPYETFRVTSISKMLGSQETIDELIDILQYAMDMDSDSDKYGIPVLGFVPGISGDKLTKPSIMTDEAISRQINLLRTLKEYTDD